MDDIYSFIGEYIKGCDIKFNYRISLSSILRISSSSSKHGNLGCLSVEKRLKICSLYKLDTVNVKSLL